MSEAKSAEATHVLRNYKIIRRVTYNDGHSKTVGSLIDAELVSH